MILLSGSLGGLFPLLALILLQILSPALAFYLPGLAPVNFCKKTDVSTTCKVYSTCIRTYGWVGDSVWFCVCVFVQQKQKQLAEAVQLQLVITYVLFSNGNQKAEELR